MVLVAIVAFAGIKTVDANPSFWVSVNTVATTSPTYMTPGTGTTTVTLDNLAKGGTYASDSASLNFQLTASTSIDGIYPTVKFRLEGSQDGIDWYSQANYLNTTGTTTILTGTSGDYQVFFASSTSNISASATTTRVNQSIIVQTPMRYTRAVFYVPFNLNSANVSLWADIVSKKQLPK